MADPSLAEVTLVVEHGPQRGCCYSFQGHETFLVGRAPQAHFRLPDDPYFSRLHFLVEVNPPLCRLIDLNSHNGTFVNGQRVSEVNLQEGDQITAGATVLRVRIRQASPSAPTMPEGLPSSTAAGLSWVSEWPETADADLAAHQRQAWQQGRRWRVSDYLRRYPILREDRLALLDLVVGEFVLRRRMGERPEVAEYVLQYPQLAGALELALEGERGLGSSDDANLPAPPTIAGYQLLEELGSGGMGVVYQAVREQDGAVVALKTIYPRGGASTETVARFLREVRILSQLHHPNIVAYSTMGTAGEVLYFVMEYVPGRDAAALVRQQGPLPVARAVRLALQMLEGLRFAHAQGYIHRDLKPGNLLIAQQEGGELAKVADFGLARAYQASTLSGLTLSGVSAGTPQYMAPEQIRDFRSVQPTADQYAAAATLYYLLTGHPPHEPAPSLQVFFQQVLQGEPVRIERRRPELPPTLADAIHQALAREPQQRFASVSALAQALQPFAAA